MPLAPKLAAAGNTRTKTFPPPPPTHIRPRCYQQGHDECACERKTWHGGGVSNMYRIPWQGDNEMFRYTNGEIKNRSTVLLLLAYTDHF